MDDDGRLEQAIGELLDLRRAGTTICPSEAARRVDPEEWRELMPAARAAAGRLAAAGQVEVTQGGRSSTSPRPAARSASAGRRR